MSIIHFVTDYEGAIETLEDVLYTIENWQVALSGTPFICHILSGKGNQASEEIQAFIRHAIGWGAVGSWLEDNHKEFHAKQYHPVQYRIAWVKSMINELNAAIELENK